MSATNAAALATGAEPVERTESWRHGGWYTNLRYPSGASGCVAKLQNIGWRIACDPRENPPTFKTWQEAARAEAALVALELA